MDTRLLIYHNPRLTPEARWLLMQWSWQIGLDQSVVGSRRQLYARLGMTYAQGRRAWRVLSGQPSQQHQENTPQKDQNAPQPPPLVEAEPLPPEGPGRPASRYRVAAALLDALAEGPSSPQALCHVDEITTLAQTTRLSDADDDSRDAPLVKGRRCRRSGLTLPNRWLLMVLLAHADTPGIVTRLSIAALQRLTGMSRARLSSQLDKLRDLGVIAHHQPGRYGPLASTRKTSIYCLDLAHPLLGNEDMEAVTVYLTASESWPPRRKGGSTALVDGLVDAAMTAGVCVKQYRALKEHSGTIDDDKGAEANRIENRKDEVDKIDQVVRQALALLPKRRYLTNGLDSLLLTHDAADADWLLACVHTDAMRLLSTAWAALEEGTVTPDTPDAEVIDGIAHRLGCLSLLPSVATRHTAEATVVKREAEEEADEEEVQDRREHDPCDEHGNDDANDGVPSVPPLTAQYPPVVTLLYALSHHLANFLQGALRLHASQHGDIEWETMAFTLIPVFPDDTHGHAAPVWKLSGYALRSNGVTHLPTALINPVVVRHDLRTYWQTHYPRIIEGASTKRHAQTAPRLPLKSQRYTSRFRP